MSLSGAWSAPLENVLLAVIILTFATLHSYNTRIRPVMNGSATRICREWSVVCLLSCMASMALLVVPRFCSLYSTVFITDLIGHVSLFASRTNHCFFADDARASLIVNLCTEILLWGSFAFSVATACLGARLSGRMTPKEYCCYLVRIHNHPEHDVTIVPVLLCILVAIYLVYMSTMFVVAYEMFRAFTKNATKAGVARSGQQPRPAYWTIWLLFVQYGLATTEVLFLFVDVLLGYPGSLISAARTTISAANRLASFVLSAKVAHRQRQLMTHSVSRRRGAMVGPVDPARRTCCAVLPMPPAPT
ncbi:G-protein coupled receptors family 1 profile domain-containing protein [Plasmodiophora brassicae]|uniref:Uncharacterized protein n=1 Tax=Plasmodiophora brassicae TaxID=37360 RepID=A0A3P3YAI3_PLABS|nr:unnamed protein product [Plasmodiophora brassicae]